MRVVYAFVLAALVPLASAQTVEREIRVERDGDRVRRVIVMADTTDDAPRTVEIRLDSLIERAGGLFGPDGVIGERMRRFEIEMEDGRLRVRTDDGASETRERMRDLERDARRLAERARGGDRVAERELDGVLAELFEVRGEMRRERAAALRERAQTLQDEAAALDEETQRRDRDRRRIIEARKRELLDDGATADW